MFFPLGRFESIYTKLFFSGTTTSGPISSGTTSDGAGSTVDPLLSFSLPAGPITDNDIPQIKTVIQQVIDKIDESIKGQKGSASDVKPLLAGILNIKDWLSKQKCVQQVSVPLVEAPDKYNDVIFLSYPGQIPINIVFNIGEKKTAEYRMLVYASTADFLKFASFIENPGMPKPYDQW